MVDFQRLTDNLGPQRPDVQLVFTGHLTQGARKSEHPGAYVDVATPTLHGFILM